MAQHRTTAADPAEAILAAIGRLGQATARDIAAEAGVAYSTTTRNLRDLAAAGRADKLTDDAGRTLWQLPQPGSDRAQTPQPHPHHETPAAVTDQQPAGADITTGPGPLVDQLVTQAGGDPGNTDDSSPEPLPDTLDRPTFDSTTTGDTTTGDTTTGDGATGDGTGADEVHAIDEVDSGAAGDTEQVAGTGQPADVSASPPAAQTAEPAAGGRAQDPADSAKPRRAHGTLRGAVLDILEAHPGQGFKVGELCKLIDATNEGSEVAKASPGAVVLACQGLVAKGNAVLAVEKPATFQLATGGE